MISTKQKVILILLLLIPLAVFMFIKKNNNNGYRGNNSFGIDVKLNKIDFNALKKSPDKYLQYLEKIDPNEFTNRVGKSNLEVIKDYAYEEFWPEFRNKINEDYSAEFELDRIPKLEIGKLKKDEKEKIQKLQYKAILLGAIIHSNSSFLQEQYLSPTFLNR